MSDTVKRNKGVLLKPKQDIRKPNILILYHSLYGHLFPMAEAVGKGVEISGGLPVFRQVEEVIPRKLWTEPIRKAKEKMKKIKVADPYVDLKDIDGIIVGGPARYGTVSAQMKTFWDQTHQAWSEGLLNGKPAGVFGSTATQHGGNEMVLINMIITLMHHGCVIVGLPFNDKISSEGLRTIDEISGGTPYGATTITGALGERTVSHNELMLARLLGQTVCLTAAKLMVVTQPK